MMLRPATLITALALSMLFSSNLFANPCLLPNFKADYRVTYLGIPIATATAEFEITKNHYRYNTNTLSTLIFTHHSLLEKSDGKLKLGHLEPQIYQYHYINRKISRNVNINFDWSSKHVTNKTENEAWKMKVPNYTQDKLGYQIELAHDICLGKKQITYHIADGGKLKTYNFEITGKEIIKTKLGKLETIKVIRKPLPGKRDTTLWLAPSMHYLVVRATQTDSTAGLAVAEMVNVGWKKHA